MPWLLLVVAGLLEVGWAYAMKRSEGFTQPGWSIAFAIMLVASMALLSIAVRTIPLGTGYAVWVGIGAAGTAIVGMALLGEPVTAPRIACLVLLIASIVGLELSSG